MYFVINKPVSYGSVIEERSRSHLNVRFGVGKEKLMRQALMMELKSAGEDLPELRQIARRVINCALNDEKNWSWAVKEIWDRLDGKSHQTVEASFDDKRSALDWTTDELVAFLRER
jgi:hypothetical protein